MYFPAFYFGFLYLCTFTFRTEDALPGLAHAAPQAGQNGGSKSAPPISVTPSAGSAGGGTGSLTKFEGGNPKNRSEKINIEHGSEDRSRIKEKVEPTPDDKKISV